MKATNSARSVAPTFTVVGNGDGSPKSGLIWIRPSTTAASVHTASSTTPSITGAELSGTAWSSKPKTDLLANSRIRAGIQASGRPVDDLDPLSVAARRMPSPSPTRRTCRPRDQINRQDQSNIRDCRSE
jgi:hypothetical protein